MRLLRLAVCATLLPLAAHAQERPWSIDPKPLLTLGDANNDRAVLFGAGLEGATRMPDGNILVADRGKYSLKVFDMSGKLVKSLGRKGSGPGEFVYVSDLWRCGNDIVVADIENGYRITVFSTDLALKRSFRFGAPLGNSTPYASSCNAAGTFVHNGWEKRSDMKGGVFRSRVPIWLSGIDSTVRPVGDMPGSERWGLVIDNQLRGTHPLPLGRQPVLAMGADRFYVGTADSYSISVHDLNGRVTGTSGKPNARLAATRDDIELAIDMEAAGRTVFEIGRDYVLGKYVDPVEDIPEIRHYRLRR